MVIRITDFVPPRQYDDGSTDTIGVGLANNDGTTANTGRGFEHIRDAMSFVEGIQLALRTLNIEYTVDRRAEHDCH